MSGCPPPSLLHPTTLTLDKLKQETGWPGFTGLLNLQTVVATVGYYALSMVLYKFLPGDEYEGSELRGGGKLKYRFNGMDPCFASNAHPLIVLSGFTSACFVLILLAAGTFVEGPYLSVWTFINDNYIALLTTNIIISYVLATYVYIKSFSVRPNDPSKRELAQGGVSGNIIYDWYIGRELNPRIHVPLVGEVDIKSFCELRPGMLGWMIMDLAFVMKQWAAYGRVTDSICKSGAVLWRDGQADTRPVIVTITQSVYILDALYNESAILTTMDITTDGFGFMLAFGDLAWLPFIYSIQAKYLSVHPVELGLSGIAAIVAVQAVGYYVFRSSNSEKNTFRTNPDDPSVKHLTFIQTQRGTKLITSGWWGSARHINYLGDWVMSWSYCLPTLMSGYVVKKSIITGENIVTQGLNGEMRGWAIPITYFYMLYFAVLLIHREQRDEQKCRRKYGKDWEEYCKKVPWRIVPGVY